MLAAASAVRWIVNEFVEVLTATLFTVAVPLGWPWRVATTADDETMSIPGVTLTLLAPAAIVATPAHWSSFTRPIARMA